MEKIKVAIRTRPLIDREEQEEAKNNWRVQNNTICQLNGASKILPNTTYTFDYIYDQTAPTTLLYDQLVAPIVQSVVEGFNGTVFAYGQTSSGKTYTMMGADDLPGIIPFTFMGLFKHIEQSNNCEFVIRLSYMEIYNECIMDLLNPSNANLNIRESNERIPYVANLTEAHITDFSSIDLCLYNGERNRHTGRTNMNERSSRSHTLLRLILESKMCDEGTIKVSHLNLVDLAGSERASATTGDGVRFKEGTFINKSLLTLGTVIRRLSEAKRDSHIPYRDSKLTRILESYLGGNAKTVIICTITTATIEETHSTLRFASRAKSVENHAIVNEYSDDSDVDTMLKRLKRLESENLDLKKKLSEDASCRSQLQDMESKISSLKSLVIRSNTGMAEPLDNAQPTRRYTMGALPSKRAIDLKLVDRENLLSPNLDTARRMMNRSHESKRRGGLFEPIKIQFDNILEEKDSIYPEEDYSLYSRNNDCTRSLSAGSPGAPFCVSGDTIEPAETTPSRVHSGVVSVTTQTVSEYTLSLQDCTAIGEFAEVLVQTETQYESNTTPCMVDASLQTSFKYDNSNVSIQTEDSINLHNVTISTQTESVALVQETALQTSFIYNPCDVMIQTECLEETVIIHNSSNSTQTEPVPHVQDTSFQTSFTSAQCENSSILIQTECSEDTVLFHSYNGSTQTDLPPCGVDTSLQTSLSCDNNQTEFSEDHLAFDNSTQTEAVESVEISHNHILYLDSSIQTDNDLIFPPHNTSTQNSSIQTEDMHTHQTNISTQTEYFVDSTPHHMNMQTDSVLTVDTQSSPVSFHPHSVITQFPEEQTTMDGSVQTECIEKMKIESISIQTGEEFAVDNMLECFIQTETDDFMTVDASVNTSVTSVIADVQTGCYQTDQAIQVSDIPTYHSCDNLTSTQSQTELEISEILNDPASLPTLNECNQTSKFESILIHTANDSMQTDSTQLCSVATNTEVKKECTYNSTQTSANSPTHDSSSFLDDTHNESIIFDLSTKLCEAEAKNEDLLTQLESTLASNHTLSQTQRSIGDIINVILIQEQTKLDANSIAHLLQAIYPPELNVLVDSLLNKIVLYRNALSQKEPVSLDTASTIEEIRSMVDNWTENDVQQLPFYLSSIQTEIQKLNNIISDKDSCISDLRAEIASRKLADNDVTHSIHLRGSDVMEELEHVKSSNQVLKTQLSQSEVRAREYSSLLLELQEEKVATAKIHAYSMTDEVTVFSVIERDRINSTQVSLNSLLGKVTEMRARVYPDLPNEQTGLCVGVSNIVPFLEQLTNTLKNYINDLDTISQIRNAFEQERESLVDRSKVEVIASRVVELERDKSSFHEENKNLQATRSHLESHIQHLKTQIESERVDKVYLKQEHSSELEKQSLVLSEEREKCQKASSRILEMEDVLGQRDQSPELDDLRERKRELLVSLESSEEEIKKCKSEFDRKEEEFNELLHDFREVKKHLLHFNDEVIPLMYRDIYDLETENKTLKESQTSLQVALNEAKSNTKPNDSEYSFNSSLSNDKLNMTELQAKCFHFEKQLANKQRQINSLQDQCRNIERRRQLEVAAVPKHDYLSLRADKASLKAQARTCGKPPVAPKLELDCENSQEAVSTSEHPDCKQQ